MLLRQPERLDRLLARLLGPDPNRVLDGADKNLAVADLAGLGRLDDCVHSRRDLAVPQHDFDLYLRQEIHRVLAPAINLGMPLLAAKAFNRSEERRVGK